MGYGRASELVDDMSERASERVDDMTDVRANVLTT